MKRSDGFTLIEILVVIGIIGILLDIFGTNLINSIRRANLQEAQTVVATEFTRARSIAQRSSSDQPITWTANTLNIGSKSVPVPNGAQIVNAAPASAYTYTAPHGEFLAPTGQPEGLMLELVDATGRYHTAVIALGVTGKVVRRGVLPASEPIN